MRSDRRRHLLALLRSQGLGLACGFAVVVLLGAGSFVMAATRDGASAGIAMDDLRPFFERPSWAHAWFYALLPVFGLYAVNTALATWHSAARRWRAGVRAPAAYAPAALHVAFLVALGGHAVGGLAGEERDAVVVADAWTALPNGATARLADLDVELLPGGMPKSAWARLEVRDADGGTREERVGYNAPLSSGWGSDLHLLSEFGRTGVAELEVARERCAGAQGATCGEAPRRVRVLQVFPPGMAGSAAAARVAVELPGGWREAWISGAAEVALPDGRPARLLEARISSAVLLRSRWAPGHPVALVAGLLASVGLALMWRRFLPRARRKAAAVEDEARRGVAA